MYEYKCVVTKVIDGDTVHAIVDLGCDIAVNMTIRLAEINAPEMNTAGGIRAKAFVEDWFHLHENYILRTVKDRREKYGRYLGYFIPENGASLNEELLQSGNASRYRV